MKRRCTLFALICVAFVISLYSISYADTDITIDEQVLVDEQGIKITATGYSELFNDPSISLSIQNDTDYALDFGISRTSVNGIMIRDAMMSKTVEPKSTTNAAIEFMSYMLEDQGIEKIAELETVFNITGDEGAPSFETNMVSIQTSAYDSYTQQYDDSGETLLEKDGIKVVKKEPYITDFLSGQYYYVSNDSDKRIRIVATNNTVNGISMEGEMTYKPIEAGKKCKDLFSFFKTDLTKAGINNINELSSDFVFYDADTDEELFREHVYFSGNETGILTAPQMKEGQAYSDSYVEVSLSNLNIDNMGDSTLTLSIKNVSGTTLSYSFDGLSVNGTEVKGTSGQSSFDSDFLEKIEPGETYETTVTIRRNSLLENSISKIEAISLNLSFIAGLDVHDITVNVPFNNDASSTASIGGDLITSAEEYIVNTHFITADDGTVYVLYELKNPNQTAVSLTGNLSFEDDNKKTLDTGEDSIAFMNPDTYNFMIFSTKSGATKMTITLKPSVAESKRAELHYDEVTTSPLKITVKNIGDNAAYRVRLTVIFMENGRITGFSRNLNGKNSVDLMPGESAVHESNFSYDKYLLYFDGITN